MSLLSLLPTGACAGRPARTCTGRDSAACGTVFHIWMGPEDLAPTTDGRIVGHQLSLGPVAGEAHDDDPTWLDTCDDAVTEGGVDDILAEPVGIGGRGGV